MTNNIPLLPEMSDAAATFQRALWAMRGQISLAPPPIDQAHQWRAELNASFRAPSETIASYGHRTITDELGGVPVVRIEKPGAANDIIAIHFHGGGYVIGEPEDGVVHDLVEVLDGRVISVAYRKAPDAPYPAALDDAFSVYAAVIAEHGAGRVALTGLSAGAGLALLTAIAARDSGLPLPAAIVALTPWVDLSETGDSVHHISTALEPLGSYAEAGLHQAATAFAAGRDLQDPAISPLYADYTTGFCPVMLSCGTRDWFLSGCARLQRRLRQAGIPVDLQVWEGFGHSLEGHGLPESRESLGYAAAFIRAHARP